MTSTTVLGRNSTLDENAQQRTKILNDQGKSIPQQTPRRVLGDLKNSAAQRQSLSTRKGSLLQTPRVNIDQKGSFQKLKKASEKKQFKKEKTVLPAKSSGTLPSDADSEIEYMAPPEVDKKEPFVTPSFIKSFVNFKPLLLPRKRLSHKQNDQEEINFEEILSASQPEHLISHEDMLQINTTVKDVGLPDISELDLLLSNI